MAAGPPGLEGVPGGQGYSAAGQSAEGLPDRDLGRQVPGDTSQGVQGCANKRGVLV